MSIIGISGRIGSGKDTVGKIIQSICAKDFGVYKTQLDFINGGDWVREKQSGWEIKKFAGKLKEIASLLTGVPVEMFEDQEFKQSYLGEQWAKTPVSPLSDATLFDKVDLDNLMTYREFLQKLGTEAMRDGLHTNVWVNALFADYKLIPAKYEDLKEGQDILTKEWKFPNWIITDLRFPNEMDGVKEKGGITIKVVRPCLECGGTGYHKMSCSKQYQMEHISEIALDGAKFDYEIINDGTIEDLIEKVRTILIKEKII
jgi:hypothetical protein